MSSDKDSKNNTSEEAAEEASNYPGDNLSSIGGKSDGKWKLFILELAAVGAVATGLWVFGEHLDKNGYPHVAAWVNFLSCDGFFSVAPIAVLKFWPDKTRVWSKFAIFSIAFAVIWGIVLYGRPRAQTDISVEPGVTLDPKDPFQTRFTLINKSDSPIFDVTYVSFWKEGFPDVTNSPISYYGIDRDNMPILPDFWTLMVNIITNSVPEVGPHAESDLACATHGVIPSSGGAILSLEIQFRTTKTGPKQAKFFNFYAIRDAEGKYAWFHSGIGDMGDLTNWPVLNRSVSPFSMIPDNETTNSVCPMVKVGMIGLELLKTNHSALTNSRQFRIIYSIENHGDSPAFAFSDTWMAYSRSSHKTYAWRRLDPPINAPPLGQESRIASRVFSDPDGFVASAIQNGELICQGQFRFKDLLGRDYGLAIDFLYTNNAYSIIGVHLGGVYGDAWKRLAKGAKSN